MRKVSLAALALSAAITTQARADYVWQFVPTKVTAMDLSSGGGFGYTPDPTVSHKEAKSWVPTFSISVTNQAFASRSLDLSWSGCQPGEGCYAGPAGDFSKIVAFDGFYGIDPSRLYGSGIIDLAWTKGGSLTGDIELYGDVTDLTLTSDPGRKMDGWYAADDSECGMQVARCNLTGHWAFLGDPPDGTSVPEPASIAMLAIGLLGVGAVRRFG